MTNDAAERLLNQVLFEYRMTTADKRALVKEALAAERRATVERIRAALDGVWTNYIGQEGRGAAKGVLRDVRAILAIEAEADRSLLLDAALRALVAAEDAIESLPAPSHLAFGFDELQDALEDALAAARAALAATDVRGALAEALHQTGYEHGLRLPDHIPDWPDLADAILAALAAKGVEG